MTWRTADSCPVCARNTSGLPKTPRSGFADAAGAAARATTQIRTRRRTTPPIGASQEALDLHVRQEDARDADRDDAGDPEHARAAVEPVRAAEARERQHRERAGGEPSEMAADGDPEAGERE